MIQWLDPHVRRLFLLLCFAQMTISFNLAAIAAVIPSISRDLGLSDLQVARIIPHYLWAYGLGALVYAPLSRWFSLRVILGWALVVFSLSSLYCGLTHSLSVLLVANVINGIAASSVVPLGLMAIGKLGKKEKRGRMVGLFFSASFISSLTGVVVSGLVHWSFLFIIPAVLGIITLLLILFYRLDLIAKPFTGKIDYGAVIRDQPTFKIFCVIFGMSFLYHGVYKWYGIFLDREYHLAQPSISSLILLTSLSGALGQNLGGMVSDRKGRLLSIELGLWMLGLAVVLLAIKMPVVGVAIVLGVISMGWTITHNGISTVLTDLPDRFRSEVASLNSSIRFVSGGLGFYLSGFLVNKSFTLNFVLNGVMILLLVFVIRRVFISSECQKSCLKTDLTKKLS